MDDRHDQQYARAPEPGDLVRICKSLNSLGAKYVLIGGFALIAHGASRFTKDIDLLIEDSPENVRLVTQALSILADNAAADVIPEDIRNHVVVRVADEIVVDLMGRACGLTYADVVADAHVIELDQVPVPVASPATLIRTKDTFRPQDAIDRDYLRRILE